LIGIITMLLRAFPSLERLFSLALDQHKAFVAEKRRNEKYNKIDSAISDAVNSGMSADKIEWGGRDVGSSTIQTSGTVRSEIHGSSTKKTS